MRSPNATSILRALPSLAALGLLAFALLGATDPNAPRAVPDAMVYPNCSIVVQSAPAEPALSLPPGGVVVQPLGTTFAIAACSLAVLVPPIRASEFLSVVSWDPVALAPDPTTAALRNETFFLSISVTLPLRRFDFVPPVVLAHAPGVAEAPRNEAAIRYESALNGSIQTVYWNRTFAAALPHGLHADAGQALAPLAGPLAHVVCGGDDPLQKLMVTQSVVRLDSLFFGNASVMAQRFRVPTRTQLYWVELAFGDNSGVGFPSYGTIAVLDAEGQSTPPAAPAVRLASASYIGIFYRPAWASHVDFDTSPILQPNHDYWVWASTAGSYSLGVRNNTSEESAAFRPGVADCWQLRSSDMQWIEQPRHALDFKIVGLPLDLVSAPPPAPPVAPTFTLRAAPNPTRGAVTLAWSGARGALAFEVLDERGRRVARGDADAAPQGTWRFEGRRADGRPLPAGVYFVRASDRAGHVATERIVMVR